MEDRPLDSPPDPGTRPVEPLLPPPASTDVEPAGASPVAGAAAEIEPGESGDGDGAASTDGRGRRQVVRFRWGQRVVRIAGAIVVVGIAYYLISVFQVWSTGRADERDPVDAIVVLGAAQFDGRPSPQLAARLDHVLELWPDDVAPLVVTTGGNLPGDRFTEAESSANYLIDRGIPEEAILLEDEGGSTYESMQGVAEILGGRDLDEIVIVTDPYHALRSRLIAESVGLDANVSSTRTSVITGGASLRRHLFEGGGVAVGRIVGFDRLDAWTE